MIFTLVLYITVKKVYGLLERNTIFNFFNSLLFHQLLHADIRVLNDEENGNKVQVIEI